MSEIIKKKVEEGGVGASIVMDACCAERARAVKIGDWAIFSCPTCGRDWITETSDINNPQWAPLA